MNEWMSQILNNRQAKQVEVYEYVIQYMQAEPNYYLPISTCVQILWLHIQY